MGGKSKRRWSGGLVALLAALLLGKAAVRAEDAQQVLPDTNAPVAPDQGISQTPPTDQPAAPASPSEASPELEAKQEEVDPEPVKEVKGKEKSLTLSVGISRTLEFDFDIGPIVLPDDSLLSFRRNPKKPRVLRLLPKAPGVTDMTIHDLNEVPRITYSIRVTREDIGQTIAQLEELLGDIEGLQIKPVGSTIVLDGEILLPKDMVRIIRVVDALKDRDAKKKNIPIKNVATISRITMNIIAERIEREVGSPDIQVRVLNNNILLEGTAQSDFEADRAIEIAKTYLPEVFVEKNKGEEGEIRPKAAGGQIGGLPTIIDLLRIAPRPASPPGKDIKITMNYVELTNQYDKTFSFNWKPLISDTSNIGYSSALGELSASLVATVSSLFPKLIQAKSHGHARILKQEQIIVKDRSEREAAIESAVDFYTRTVNETGQSTLSPITVQNLTKVRAATIPGSDSIELAIQLTLNSLIGNNQGAPIIAKNSLQTQVIVKNGDSAALGGYAIDEALSGYNREPSRGLADSEDTSNTTALFNLERSKNYSRNKTQYVIFVTPEVIRTASAGTEDITRKFRLNAGER